MADIKNKNELKRRIELFLDELDYSINEDFCKETMKMMKEIVEQLEEKALVKECDVGGLVPSREKIVILSDAIEIIKEGGTDETI